MLSPLQLWKLYCSLETALVNCVTLSNIEHFVKGPLLTYQKACTGLNGSHPPGDTRCPGWLPIPSPAISFNSTAAFAYSLQMKLIASQ